MNNPSQLKRDLIGLPIEVTWASNTSYMGCKGTIVDETKSTITIETPQKRKKMLLKSAIIFRVAQPDGVIIHGKETIGRPQEKIKRKKHG